jgi:hypothetical protein
MIIKHPECEFVALGIQRAVRMRRLWPPRIYSIFSPHYHIKKLFNDKRV